MDQEPTRRRSPPVPATTAQGRRRCRRSRTGAHYPRPIVPPPSVHEAGPSVHEAGPSVHEAGPSVHEAGPSVRDAGPPLHAAGAAAPPVVAVVVTDGVRGRLEQVIDSLAAQDYPNLRVLILATGQS